MARLNPRLNLPREIRRIVGTTGAGAAATVGGGTVLIATPPHHLDGPEHTAPTLSTDLEGAQATLKVKALQGVDVKTMATDHLLGRHTAGAGPVESLAAATVAAMLGAAAGIEVTDGTHDVTGATRLTVTGGIIGGTTPDATLTITGGGGAIWVPLMAGDGSGNWYVATDGNGNAIMVS